MRERERRQWEKNTTLLESIEFCARSFKLNTLEIFIYIILFEILYHQKCCYSDVSHIDRPLHIVDGCHSTIIKSKKMESFWNTDGETIFKTIISL